jgi:hypothetical protein
MIARPATNQLLIFVAVALESLQDEVFGGADVECSPTGKRTGLLGLVT